MDKQEQEVKTSAEEQESTTEVKAKESQSQSEKAPTEDLTKKEIAGLNRRISELEKIAKQKDEELKKALREKMTEEERKKAEKEDLEKEKLSIAKEKRELTVMKALAKAGLDPEKFARRIVGDTQEEIEQDVQDLKALLDEKSLAIADKKVKDTLKVKSPKGGESKKKLTLDEIEKLPTREERVKAYKDNGYVK